MSISSNNYPNVIYNNGYTNSGSAKTTVQQRLEMLSTPSKPSTTETENKSSFGFGDLIDIVNPLQHIPVVSSVYRHITGDEIGGVARVAGGGLFGGAIGAFLGAFETAVKGLTGKDMGEHAYAIATYDQGQQTVQTAENTSSPVDNYPYYENSENNYQEPVSTSSLLYDRYQNNSQKAVASYAKTAAITNQNKTSDTNTFMPLKKEERMFSLKDEPKKFEISRKTEEKTFDLNTQRDLNYIYAAQMMPLDVESNTLDASKVSHLKKDNKESIDFWSRATDYINETAQTSSFDQMI